MSAIGNADAKSRVGAGGPQRAVPDDQIKPSFWITLQRGKAALSPFCAVTFSRFVHARAFPDFGAKLNYWADCKKADISLHRSEFWSGSVKVRTLRPIDRLKQSDRFVGCHS